MRNETSKKITNLESKLKYDSLLLKHMIQDGVSQEYIAKGERVIQGYKNELLKLKGGL